MLGDRFTTESQPRLKNGFDTGYGAIACLRLWCPGDPCSAFDFGGFRRSYRHRVGWKPGRRTGAVLPLLSADGRISVLTVQDEKSLSGSGLAQTLAASLALREYSAGSVDINLDSRTIAESLQCAALAEGAQLLVMGGFGHSRLRDFIRGGATKGVFSDLQLAVLLSH